MHSEQTVIIVGAKSYDLPQCGLFSKGHRGGCCCNTILSQYDRSTASRPIDWWIQLNLVIVGIDYHLR